MGELSSTIQQRLSEAYDSLHTAHAEGDAFLADARQAEIEDLHRIAANHNIDARGAPDLTPPLHGQATP